MYVPFKNGEKHGITARLHLQNARTPLPKWGLGLEETVSTPQVESESTPATVVTVEADMDLETSPENREKTPVLPGVDAK